jgi:hypothetical protein
VKKTISIFSALLLAVSLLGGCAPDTSAPAFTHGIYQVGYTTAVSWTDAGKPAVQVTYPYYVDSGKKVKDASDISLVFDDGGLYGIYLKVDGLAYPVTSVDIDHTDSGAVALSVVEVPGVTEHSVIEVCSAGLDDYVERNGNRIYYAPYLLGQPAENGSRQVLIDLAYINGMDMIRKDVKISGPCANFSDEIRTFMEKEPFTVTVGDTEYTEYTANTLRANIYGTASGSLSFGRLMLIIDVPADTPADVTITVR